ncbi:DUF4270 domain-containing protein [Flavobacteriaceae bacterium MHTCC 0001]
MKKINKALNYLVPLLFLVLIISCDKDYSTIDSNVLGNDNFNFIGEVDSTYSVTAYNQSLNRQQANGLPSNLLGFFNDEFYGSTTASIVTQLLPTTEDPEFGNNPVLDSMQLTIPYLSTQTGISDDNIPEYRLDYFYIKDNDFNNISPIKLSVYTNLYFLRNFSISSPDTPNYFSLTENVANPNDNYTIIENDTINFDEQKGFLILETELKPSAQARKVVTGDGDDTSTSYLKPAIVLDLAETQEQKDYWSALILSQEGQPTLSNANNFVNYFRGLYLKAEAVNNSGSMFLLNLANNNSDDDARIVMYISSDDENSDGNRKQSTYTFSFNGNKINTFINNYNTDVLNVDPNPTDGDEKLHIKGSEGGMAIVELFNDDNDKKIDCNCGKDSNGNTITVNVTEFECFKRTYRKTDDDGNFLDPINGQYQLKRLINEAHLTIYEHEDSPAYHAISDDDYPDYDRLFIYDLENNTPVTDYNTDPTVNATDPVNSRSFSLAKEIDEATGLYKYKIKLTDHLNNILIGDQNNVKLGLVLSNNINISTNAEILSPSTSVTGTPAPTITTPTGLVLKGNNPDNPEGYRQIKLKIFYTGTE